MIYNEHMSTTATNKGADTMSKTVTEMQRAIDAVTGGSAYGFQGMTDDGMARYISPATPGMISTDGGNSWDRI